MLQKWYQDVQVGHLTSYITVHWIWFTSLTQKCQTDTFSHESKISTIDYCSQALSNTKGITLASLNICSLTRKHDEVKILLDNSKIDLLALNESFLNKSITDSQINIEGYRLWRHDRTLNSGKSHGGGIVVYSTLDRDIRPIENGSFCTLEIETLLLEMKLTNSRPKIICSIYRPPDANLEEGLLELQNQFEH